jgi:CHAT domain
LSDYRIVYFATHGLVAGDVKGLAEPSLALTIPSSPSDEDDGLLTLSEVSMLKLNADLVVLSACNTIAGDRPGAEALTGLAKAFFYAGAKAMIVSHWGLASDAATRLMTDTFGSIQGDRSIDRRRCAVRCCRTWMTAAILSMPIRHIGRRLSWSEAATESWRSAQPLISQPDARLEHEAERLQLALDCRFKSRTRNHRYRHSLMVPI